MHYNAHWDYVDLVIDSFIVIILFSKLNNSDLQNLSLSIWLTN